MIPNEVKNSLENVLSEYNRIYKENVQLRLNNEKLKDEVVKMTKKTAPATSTKKEPTKRIIRGSDFVINNKGLLKIKNVAKLKYSAPITNVAGVYVTAGPANDCENLETACSEDNETDYETGSQAKFYAFTCNGKIFLKENDKLFLISKHLMAEYDPATMKRDLDANTQCTYTFLNDTIVVLIDEVAVQYNLFTKEKLCEISLAEMYRGCSCNGPCLYAPGICEVSRCIICCSKEHLFLYCNSFIYKVDTNLQFIAKYNCVPGVKQMCWFDTMITFITVDSVGVVTDENKMFYTKTKNTNMTLSYNKNVIYVSENTNNISMYAYNACNALEHVDTIAVNCTKVIAVAPYLQDFLIVSCAKGTNYILQIGTRKHMKILTEENITSLVSVGEELLMLNAAGKLTVFTGWIVQKEVTKTLLEKMNSRS